MSSQSNVQLIYLTVCIWNGAFQCPPLRASHGDPKEVICQVPCVNRCSNSWDFLTSGRGSVPLWSIQVWGLNWSALYMLGSRFTHNFQTRTTFKSVESNVRNICTWCWGVWAWLTYHRCNGLCLSWKINYSTHSDLYLQVPSQWGKEPHCFQTKVTLYLWLPNLVPTQVAQNLTGCGLSASAHGLQDLGELHSLTKRDSSFPSSTPCVVPSILMCIQ